MKATGCTLSSGSSAATSVCHLAQSHALRVTLSLQKTWRGVQSCPVPETPVAPGLCRRSLLSLLLQMGPPAVSCELAEQRAMQGHEEPRREPCRDVRSRAGLCGELCRAVRTHAGIQGAGAGSEGRDQRLAAGCRGLRALPPSLLAAFKSRCLCSTFWALTEQVSDQIVMQLVLQILLTAFHVGG